MKRLIITWLIAFAIVAAGAVKTAARNKANGRHFNTSKIGVLPVLQDEPRRPLEASAESNNPYWRTL